jgi:hypothetical protein
MRLAKTADLAQSEVPELAELRARIVRIILDEYIGDLGGGELWTRPAIRATDRIVEAIALGANAWAVPSVPRSSRRRGGRWA